MNDDNHSIRRLPACDRCRSKKIKCDPGIPSCLNCLKTGSPCMNKDKVLGTVINRNNLVSKSPNATENLNSNVNAPVTTNVQIVQMKSPPPKRRRIWEDSYQEPSENFTPSAELGDSENNYDSSNDEHSSGENEFDRPLKGTIDTLLTYVSSDDKIFQYSNDFKKTAKQIFIDKEQASLVKLGLEFSKQARKNHIKDRITDIRAYDYTILIRLIRRYFNWMNSAHPVLHQYMVYNQLQRYYNRSKDITNVDIFQLKLIIAIALASISRSYTSRSELGRIAHAFWKSASKYNRKLSVNDGIVKLQNILLVIQYCLLVPKAGNLWDLSGTAMRFAIELKLYCDPDPTQNIDPLTLDLRRRIFWNCYCIDRILSTVMGRPTGIPDSWISTECPSLVEDKLITNIGIDKSEPLCHLKVTQLQQIRLSRLQSEIHNKLYSFGHSVMNPEELEIWSWQMYDQLRIWRSSFTYSTPFITKEWIELQFHITVVLLFRPSQNRTKLSSDTLHVAFHSAGEVMSVVKVKQRDFSANFSWLTIQNLFMCGLTLVNSLRELTSEHNSCHLCTPLYEVFSYIQSCSTMLETLSALEQPAYEDIRNAFEIISSSVLKTVANIPSDLPKNNSNAGGCIWSQIAKSDDNLIARPIVINNFSIPIKINSPILDKCNPIGYKYFMDVTKDDHEHFFKHDIDASKCIDLRISDSNLYQFLSAKKKDINDLDNNGDLVQSDTSSFPPFSPVNSNRETEDLNMLMHSPDINGSNDGSQTIFNWSETEISAELDRWFRYPLPEIGRNINL